MRITQLMKLSFFVLIVALLVVINGCVVEKQMVDPYAEKQKREDAMREEGIGLEEPLSEEPGQDVEPVVDVQDVLLPTLTLINDRIYAYEEKLKSLQNIQQQAVEQTLNQQILNRISDCRVELQNILVAYNALHKRLMKQTDLQAAELLAGESLFAISEQDIKYLEGECGQNLDIVPSVTQPVAQVRITSLFAQEQALKDAFNGNDFSRAINIYEQLPLESEQAPPFDLTYLYGLALMKTNRAIEARKVLTDLLTKIRLDDQALWEFRLMQLLGDLEFGLELYGGARNKYKEIGTIYENLESRNEWAMQQLAALDRSSYDNDEVREYAVLLRSYLEYNPDRDGYTVVGLGEKYIETFPYSTVSSNVDELLVRARRQADEWLDSVFSRIDQLSQQGQFQEALLFIERIPRSILPLDKQEQLKRKTEELITSESIAIETDRLVVEQEFEADWNKAMNLLEAKQYDHAIEVFSTLLASPYEAKARLRIDEAATLAAKEDRKRAAELYVRSKRTADFESRKKLLFASRKLLQDILIKYPQSDLTEKVKRNIVRLEEEISSIDPTLLTSPEMVGGNEMPPGEILPEIEQGQSGSQIN